MGGCLLISGCSDGDTSVRELRNEARIVEGVASHRGEQVAIDFERDRKQLGIFESLFREMEEEMDGLRQSVGLNKRGYYTTDEHDQVMGLLFRYLVAREASWDLISIHGEYSKTGDEDERAKSTLLALWAASMLRDTSATMVNLFYANEEVVKKLNEANHEMGVSKGTFQKIFMQLTSGASIGAVDDAFEAFGEARQERTSPIGRLERSEKAWEMVCDRIPLYYESSKEKIDALLLTSAIGLPRTRNAIRHSETVKSVSQRLDGLMEELYATRGKISDTFTGLKSPLSELAVFSEKQKKELKAYLKPGDILLTYTEGYMSNVFLPGMFKHGITYVGSVAERSELGLEDFNVSKLPRSKQAAFYRAVGTSEIEDGKEADLVEAVAAGVIFNSLQHILDTHTNRLLVLRPQLSREELQDQLAKTLLLVGDDYDFNFDFTNGSRHCCTEVVYRALHGKGRINFELVSRMGLQTLSADDIIAGFMDFPGQAFEFVLFAEEEGRGSAKARIYSGEKGFSFFRKRWSER
ncbi:MAG: YiiX/YebB-like N1pC/P60 family cysteine hydrolase [Verrucomicrobiota bacterium]